MGCGKSSLSNMFVLGDEEQEIQFGTKKILFPIGSGEKAMT